ncbi:unnamed protein product [Plutella xylostella]|uniref:(diamondback moth) hypothetical protein n=1 Tax=Plutella xylostella TaxID=51655 RepID=A0A8S4F8L9_PLUXY|nr:unnamed protein product [Plutella xylostella]
MAGVVIFEKVALVLSVRQLSVVFVTYATVYISRLLVYATLMPVLKFAGFQITWQHSLSLVWGGLRGPLSLFMALIVLETPGVADAGEIFIIQISGVVMLSLLINATTMLKVLKILGLSEISYAKKANMTNCVRRIMITRDRCISMLKMDKFLADANWNLVQKGTTIKHPYQLQINRKDEDSDDDTYMGYRYTTCPDCEREIPNEPTKKEFSEMMREAKQRVLKALKISYWRQYEHGKISKEGVRTLVQAVDGAAGSPSGRVNIEALATLWKPKAHAIWIRKKLVNSLTTATVTTQMPRTKWRQRCFRIIASPWFECFVYLAILCNTPVILYEVAVKSPSKLVVTTIKSLNLLFYLIYIWEMIMKMSALGFKGYFSSNWNKLDFFIIVMATGDLVMDTIDCFTSWDKYDNVNSSFVTATKLLRMLRFLRLCKLARVLVPRIMAIIDRMIDVQLAFGYDVGKGFVTGELEVTNLLPQLVDNKVIQETLTAGLEADRLTVTRQLGLLQRDRPWTAITVKTRQATTSTLNIMLLDAMQLKEEGGGPPPSPPEDKLLEKVKCLIGPSLEGIYTIYDGDADFINQQQDMLPINKQIDPIDVPEFPKLGKRISILKKNLDPSLEASGTDPEVSTSTTKPKKKNVVESFVKLSEVKNELVEVQLKIAKNQLNHQNKIQELELERLKRKMEFEKLKQESEMEFLKQKWELELSTIKNKKDGF